MGFSLNGISATWGKIEINIQTFDPEKGTLNMTVNIPIGDHKLAISANIHNSWSMTKDYSVRVEFEQQTEESRKEKEKRARQEQLEAQEEDWLNREEEDES